MTTTETIKPFTHGSLFSGIGGFDLAAEWMGWENVFHCEWNKFGQKVLKYYWPKAISYHDITKTDFTIHRGTIDILTGGFPCQPYSLAGLRKGKQDERHLWPEMLRAIREIQPRHIVGENVPGIIDWNGGMVFEEVQTNLESEGYEVTSFILPASGVGADHQRERIWFVANSTRDRNSEWQKSYRRKELSERVSILHKPFIQTTITTSGYAQSPVCDGNDGFSSKLDGITFSKWKKESIKAGGNAIVPQVALQIFKAIELYDNL